MIDMNMHDWLPEDIWLSRKDIDSINIGTIAEATVYQALKLNELVELTQIGVNTLDSMLGELRDINRALHNPDHIQALNCCREGVIQLETGHLDNAVDFFEKAKKSMPSVWEAYVGLGVVGLLKNDLLMARESFQESLAYAKHDLRNPQKKEIKAYRAVAAIYFWENNFQDAVSVLGEAAEKHDDAKIRIEHVAYHLFDAQLCREPPESVIKSAKKMARSPDEYTALLSLPLHRSPILKKEVFKTIDGIITEGLEHEFKAEDFLKLAIASAMHREYATAYNALRSIITENPFYAAHIGKMGFSDTMENELYEHTKITLTKQLPKNPGIFEELRQGLDFEPLRSFFREKYAEAEKKGKERISDLKKRYNNLIARIESLPKYMRRYGGEVMLDNYMDKTTHQVNHLKVLELNLNTSYYGWATIENSIKEYDDMLKITERWVEYHFSYDGHIKRRFEYFTSGKYLTLQNAFKGFIKGGLVWGLIGGASCGTLSIACEQSSYDWFFGGILWCGSIGAVITAMGAAGDTRR